MPPVYILPVQIRAHQLVNSAARCALQHIHADVYHRFPDFAQSLHRLQPADAVAYRACNQAHSGADERLAHIVLDAADVPSRNVRSRFPAYSHRARHRSGDQDRRRRAERCRDKHHCADDRETREDVPEQPAPVELASSGMSSVNAASSHES
jgi:hypothetical protein